MNAIKDFIGKIEALKQQHDVHPQAASPTPLQEARMWLQACGYLPKYWERFDPALKIADGPAERALQAWISDLPRMLVEGGWLLLGGAIGTRKSFATCRIVDAVRSLLLRPGSEVRWEFAPAVAKSLRDWDGNPDDEPGSMYHLLRSKLLVLDDVDRFLELQEGDFKLGQILTNLDALMEYRDQPRRVTVVTANRFAGDMYAVPKFRRWVDRAKERGVCIDIHGQSTRWQQ